ncbi:inosine monophosphate dehydrogenase [Aureobasidium sp. EXF-8845]|nr:inosine monophosphate dehydrogenase [Aureobasidium sp. EXF-8845]KAI4858098.1 inosine monophosphate dehydrogenase [Aureobasidium sp. EXF-8846]
MPTRRLSEDYPWVLSPTIISAPMSGFAGPALAHAVYRAGGIGFLGGLRDTGALRKSLEDVTELVTGSRTPEANDGHGGEKGAGVISLIPETLFTLRKMGLNNMSIVAAGGIADGSAVAAALTLGADGVVMGTRFLAAEETTVHPAYQSAILETEDGGQTTVRAKVFDELAGPNIWPRDFDGRALIAQSYKDHIDGISIDDIRKSHAEAKQTSHLGFDHKNRRAAIWAGTGVGLVRERAPAAEIIAELRESVRTALERAVSMLG